MVEERFLVQEMGRGKTDRREIGIVYPVDEEIAREVILKTVAKDGNSSTTQTAHRLDRCFLPYCSNGGLKIDALA